MNSIDWGCSVSHFLPKNGKIVTIPKRLAEETLKNKAFPLTLSVVIVRNKIYCIPLSTAAKQISPQKLLFHRNYFTTENVKQIF